MSIITDLKESKALEKARRQPGIHFLPFSVPSLLRKIQDELFPDITHKVHVYFVTNGPLACIDEEAEKKASIYVHQVLNHSATPIEVIGMIFKHELLHLRIPPSMECGEVKQHPKAFWDAEKELCPERMDAWTWIWLNLAPCIKKRPRLERIDVLEKWRLDWGWVNPEFPPRVGGAEPIPTNLDEICW